MPQFFIQSTSIQDGFFRIAGDDFRHLAVVRRVRTGDEILIRDENGVSYTARVERLADGFLEARVVETGAVLRPPVRLTLCMSLLKGKSFDLAIEKSVEIGVARIIPVVTARTVPRPADIDTRVARWNRKAEEAAKQSLRERTPAVDGVRSFAEVISGIQEGTRIIAHPESVMSIKEVLNGSRTETASLLVGPEGGFTAGEVDAAASAGWRPAGFGFSQMRAGTAALVLCGIIVYEWS